MSRWGRVTAAVLVGLLLAVALDRVFGVELEAAVPRPAWADCAAPSAHAVPDAGERTAPEGVALTPLAKLEMPTAAAPAGDGSLLVTPRGEGVVRVGADGSVSPVLDLSDETTLDGERGVLGVAVQPDGAAAFVSYTAADGAFTLARFALPVAGHDPPRDTILEYPDAHRFHNGGHLAFGPDGMLYVGLGDGGDDYEGDPEDDAQSLDTLFGKILRIDVTSSPGSYRVPADNPFVDDDHARGEVWAYGLRNPWRFSFDAPTGDLWVADAGQFCWEEIDRIAGDRQGANFGWNRYEGGYEFVPASGPPSDVVWPVLQYPHVYEPDGDAERVMCAIVGGGVYRGVALPSLQGWYVYSDYCARAVFALDPSAQEGDRVAVLADTETPVISMATDAAGEVLVLTTDAVWRMAPSDSR